MLATHDRIRYHTLKLCALCWVLRGLRAPSVNATLRKPRYTFVQSAGLWPLPSPLVARSARRSSPVGAFVPRQRR